MYIKHIWFGIYIKDPTDLMICAHIIKRKPVLFYSNRTGYR